VVDFVYALEERYLMSDFRRGQVIAERGLVRIQGALWLAKLGVQLGRRELPRELDDHVRAMELK
jgi:hypothetical protein